MYLLRYFLKNVSDCFDAEIQLVPDDEMIEQVEISNILKFALHFKLVQQTMDGVRQQSQISTFHESMIAIFSKNDVKVRRLYHLLKFEGLFEWYFWILPCMQYFDWAWNL